MWCSGKSNSSSWGREKGKGRTRAGWTDYNVNAMRVAASLAYFLISHPRAPDWSKADSAGQVALLRGSERPQHSIHTGSPALKFLSRLRFHHGVKMSIRLLGSKSSNTWVHLRRHQCSSSMSLKLNIKQDRHKTNGIALWNSVSYEIPFHGEKKKKQPIKWNIFNISFFSGV